jgi:hypothetical protein
MTYSKKDFLLRLNYFLSKKKWVLLSFLFSLFLWIPQFMYWKSISGNYLSYSYKNEGFDFLSNPKLLEVWFSPNNGLFVYAPIVLLSLIGIIFMIKSGEKLGWYLAVLFFVISYLFASWWNWWFGCALGARSFVEFYAVLIIPFAFLLHRFKTNKIAFSLLIFCLCVFCFLNMSIEYYYDGCFYGDTWDWEAFIKLI